MTSVCCFGRRRVIVGDRSDLVAFRDRRAQVESEKLVVELDETVPGFVKSSPWGVVQIGTINSYVTVQSGICRVIAIVTAVRLFEDKHPNGDRAKRILDAVMIGRVEAGHIFTRLTFLSGAKSLQ